MSRKILMVGDEADASTALHEALEQDGFIVDSYEDPLYALAHFKAHFYDPLILDIKMPKMGGFSFYKEIQKLIKIFSYFY
jgi:two-component system, OmpR family, copper resistance phosphate regulon response regulator CusR